LLVESKRNILVLLAGTSGTGKSTLSSLLGSRLGISTVLSTDTIRHVMRNFVAKEDDPIIFASTYETAAFVSFAYLLISHIGFRRYIVKKEEDSHGV
jgi:2-phosphoglycerate kinase